MMFSHEEGYRRLVDFLATTIGRQPNNNRSKYWHRFDDLPGGVVVDVETAQRTPRRMNIYVSYNEVLGVTAPAWGELRPNDQGHTRRGSKRISNGPHHRFVVSDSGDLDQVLGYLQRLLPRSAQGPAQEQQNLEGTPSTPPDLGDFDDDYSTVEGLAYWALHQRYERDREFVRQKKAQVKANNGKLLCEVCEFDFHQRYGALGEGFIEVHHGKALHTLTEATILFLEDLHLVCANCHRMLHRKQDMTVGQLRQIIRSQHRDPSA